jgi:hypothetical protein
MGVSGFPIKMKKCLTNRRGWSRRGNLRAWLGPVVAPAGTSGEALISLSANDRGRLGYPSASSPKEVPGIYLGGLKRTTRNLV